jgi:hypothetical protein
MGLAASDVLFSEEASAALRALEVKPDPAARSIARRVRGLVSVLRADCLHGDVVKKDRIPARFMTRYALGNLYVEDLPSFWRLLYSVGRRQGERYVPVVAIVDHRTYSHWFGRRHP